MSQWRFCGNGESSSNGSPDDQALERASASKRLQRALAVCFVFMLLEIVGGSVAGSLAILTDAAHLLADVAGFAISLLALRASQWSATSQYTYGYLRLEVVGALVSVQSIWIMTGYIMFEAVQRLNTGEQLVDGRLMCFIAAVGAAANFVMIFLLGHGHEHNDVGGGHTHLSGRHHELRDNDLEHAQCLSHNQKDVRHEDEQKQHVGGDCHHQMEQNSKKTKPSELQTDEDEEEMSGLVSRDTFLSDEVHEGHTVCCAPKCSNQGHQNINIRGAYLHALGDLIQSIGVLITGIVIWVKPEWQLVDPLCSFLFSVVVMSSTFRMIKDVLYILMESTPRDVDVEAVENGLLAIQGVDAVHQLHVWALTTGTNVLTCHLHIKPVAGGAQAKDILRRATRFCTIEQKMKHVTIQIDDTLFSDCD